MKGSNQQRQLPPSSQNKLSKTQQQPPQKPDYLENTYQVQKKPTTYNDKPAVLPPRSGSSQKINYKIEENMTNSKIQVAKQGLQLLKKKMSRNGMSRDKNQRNGSVEKREEDTNFTKKNSNRQEEYEVRQQEIKKPNTKGAQKRVQKEDPYKKSPPIPTKTMEDRPIKKQVQREQFVNPNEEIPIKGNQDFMAILQRQMAKEKAGSQPIKAPVAKVAKKPIAEQEQEIELAECSKGCGRKFNINTLQKHQKICEKVFQSKRKVFNSAEFRQPQAQGDFKIPPPPPTIKQQKQKSNKVVPAKQQQKVPKWKLQSAAFRAGLKQGRGEQLSAEEKTAAQKASGMIQCGSCGRKFNEDAGKRHIAFCENKAKQMPKMNTSNNNKRR